MPGYLCHCHLSRFVVCSYKLEDLLLLPFTNRLGMISLWCILHMLLRELLRDCWVVATFFGFPSKL